MVTRYDIGSGPCGVEYAEVDGGKYVHFDDYAALQAENERLREENSLLTEALCEIDSLIDAHKGE